jgi:hypothetical protein
MYWVMRAMLAWGNRISFLLLVTDLNIQVAVGKGSKAQIISAYSSIISRSLFFIIETEMTRKWYLFWLDTDTYP